MALTLDELAEKVGGKVLGNGNCLIHSVATLDKAAPGAISFFSNSRYRKQLRETRASAVILSPANAGDSPVAALVSDNPRLSYARVCEYLYPAAIPKQGIHPSAWVSDKAHVAATAWIGPQVAVEENAVVAEGCQIGPGSVVGAGVEMGRDCRLTANVTLCSGTRLGERVVIQPGAVIGSEGFGLADDNGVWRRVPQLGGVRIGNDVDIGANTCIDCGALEDTVIEDGVKLDNQIQVAHNCHIGEHSALAGCTGIAGSTRIGKHCQIGGAVNLTGHFEIADGVFLTAGTTVTHDIREPGAYSSGTPLETNARWRRNAVRFKQLDEMAARIKALEQALKPSPRDKDKS